MTASIHDGARTTFDEFAAVYDLFTANHNHEPWIATIAGLAERHRCRGDRLLDLACGTGNSFLPMLRRGYAVTGCDISDPMLARARAKAPAAELFVADMRSLPRVGEFDLITCLDDAVNYLTDRGELDDCFRGVAANLADGGLFIFDVNTLRTFHTVFTADDCFEVDGSFLAWRGKTPPGLAPGGEADAVTEAFVPMTDGAFRRVTTRHRQRHFTDDELRSALTQARLDCAAAYGHTVSGELYEIADELAHEKRIYVARHRT